MASTNYRDASFVPQETRENFKDVIAKRPDLVRVTSGRMVAPAPGVFQKYSAGLVLGLVTASGKYAPYNPAASDGSQNPVGVLKLDAEMDSAGNGSLVVVIIGGELYKDMLIGLDAAAITALKATVYAEYGDNILKF